MNKNKKERLSRKRKKERKVKQKRMRERKKERKKKERLVKQKRKKRERKKERKKKDKNGHIIRINKEKQTATKWSKGEVDRHKETSSGSHCKQNAASKIQCNVFTIFIPSLDE